MADPLSTVLPLAATFLGAAITYGTNVRVRKRTKVEEIFHDAIAAVSLAYASKSFMWNVISDDAPLQSNDRKEMWAELARDGLTQYAKSVGRARAALARASAYDPELRPYLDTPVSAFHEQVDEIVARLRSQLK